MGDLFVQAQQLPVRGVHEDQVNVCTALDWLAEKLCLCVVFYVLLIWGGERSCFHPCFKFGRPRTTIFCARVFDRLYCLSFASGTKK